jgi:hypothetical protein
VVVGNDIGNGNGNDIDGAGATVIDGSLAQISWADDMLSVRNFRIGKLRCGCGCGKVSRAL